nr:TPA_asm: integrase [Powellomyces chytrid fungus MELD virus 5]
MLYTTKENPIQMSWVALTDEQKKKLQELYKRYPVGRDSLWRRYNEENPDDIVSQRSVLNEFLKYQESHQTLQKPPKARSIAPLNIQRLGYLQADLVSMRSYADSGYTAFFHMIDGFSKKSWGLPLRGESEAEVSAALEKCLKRAQTEDGAKFSIMQTDNGAHFQQVFKQILTSRNIKHTYSAPARPMSNSFIENRGGFVKKQLFNFMIQNKDKRWVERFQTVIDNINSTRTFSTGQSPNDFYGNEKVQTEARATISKTLNNRYKLHQTGKPLCIGQTVRIKRILQGSVRKPGVKGFYNPEIYTIAQRLNSTYANFLPSYRIKRADGTLVKNRLPKSSLLIVPPLVTSDQSENVDASDEPDIPNEAIEAAPPKDTEPRRSLRVQNTQRDEEEYEVENLVGKRKFRGKVQYLIKWVGYGNEYNEWQDEQELLRTSGYLIRQYNRIHKD